MSVTVSARVPRELKEELKRIKEEEVRKALERAARALRKISEEEIVRSIKEDRLSR